MQRGNKKKRVNYNRIDREGVFATIGMRETVRKKFNYNMKERERERFSYNMNKRERERDLITIRIWEI